MSHIRAQRITLTKVLVYGLEATAICFVGLWLLFDHMSLASKLIASGLFGAGATLIGGIAVMIAGVRAAREIEHNPEAHE